MKIPYDDYVGIGRQLSLGEQVHVNHDNCSAGIDTRKRLYIKRCEDGRILSYCHNCGESGYFLPSIQEGRGTRKSNRGTNGNVYETTRSRKSLPRDCQVYAQWPALAKQWVSHYDITPQEVANHGICYSPRLRRVILPVFIYTNNHDSSVSHTTAQSTGPTLGLYQARKIYPNDTGAKYLTYRNDSCVFVTNNNNRVDVCVICEDILSAIKLGRVAGRSIALLGTNLQEKHILTVVEGYKRFLIFLDNDNIQVKKAQIKLFRMLSAFGDVKVTHHDKDPKECSDKELERIVSL